MLTARQLWFTAPYQLDIREQHLPDIQTDQVLVKTHCSAVSAGTEMLVYRGQLPDDIALDASLEALQQTQTYPLQYGYACVGQIERIGAEVNASWLNKKVFAFQPHASHFICTPQQLMVLPDDITPEAAVFLANMETAVNLVLDGNPALGEQVVVLGQGIVGLLLSSLLAQFPLAGLHVMDGIAERCRQALRLGVAQALNPTLASQLATLMQTLKLPSPQLATPDTGADLVYEVSGVPAALNQAIELCSYSGRIVIASWYGNKSANLQLGGLAHRNRIKFISSQVSSIAPELTGRWDKARRFQVAWQMIRQVQPQTLISHRFDINQAKDIYHLLDTAPETVLQAILTY